VETKRKDLEREKQRIKPNLPCSILERTRGGKKGVRVYGSSSMVISLCI